jgi:DNA-binding SARP family transcriptional activator
MAHQRQHQLLQELAVLIDVISAPAVTKRDAQPFFPELSDLEPRNPLNILPAEYERLMRCIKDLLGPLPSPETTAQTNDLAPEPAAEGTTETVAPAVVPPAEICTENCRESVEEAPTPPASHSLATEDEWLLAPTPETSPATTVPILTEIAMATAVAPMQELTPSAPDTPPSLAIYFLSPFRVLLDEQPVGGWPNCKGKSIFKYLVTHRERPISKEVLMETFWPEVDPDSARNNLNVAIYGLRKALSKVNTDFPYVLFQDGCYLLNPELRIWVDAEAFMAHVQKAKECERRGDMAAAIHEYRAAETIYQSEFLVEDRYEEWLTGARQSFQDTYLAVMNRLSNYYYEQHDYEACVTICAKTLADDVCNEELHQRLMRCYSLMGYTHLALRQYHTCREILVRELSLAPSRETIRLFEQIRQRQTV